MTASLTTGVIMSTAVDGMVTVLLAGASVPVGASIPRDLTVAVDDLVLVGTDAGTWVLVRLGTGTLWTIPPDMATWTPPAPGRSQEAVSPVGSGSWRGGAWRSDTSQLYCGDWSGKGVNQGGVWYGTGFRGRGTLSGLKVPLIRRAGGVNGAQTPTMLLLPNDTRPGSWSAPVATVAGPALSINVWTDWYPPGAWLTALENGSAGGIGIGQAGASPYIVIDPPTAAATFN
jgi:hypothetical protein